MLKSSYSNSVGPYDKKKGPRGHCVRRELRPRVGVSNPRGDHKDLHYKDCKHYIWLKSSTQMYTLGKLDNMQQAFFLPVDSRVFHQSYNQKHIIRATQGMHALMLDNTCSSHCPWISPSSDTANTKSTMFSIQGCTVWSDNPMLQALTLTAGTAFAAIALWPSGSPRRKISARNLAASTGMASRRPAAPATAAALMLWKVDVF